MKLRSGKTYEIVPKGGKKPTTKNVTPAVKQYVKKQIDANIEDSSFQYLNTGANIYPSNAGASFNNSAIPLSPYSTFIQIGQGTGGGTRDKNEIKIKKAVLTGIIHPTAYDATLNNSPAPVEVIMWLLYDKTNPTQVPIMGTNDFLQNGPSSLKLQNTLTDLIYPVNEDRWCIKAKRTFKLGFSAYENVTGGNAPAQYFSNNDFKFNCKFKIDYTKHLVKHVKFNDTINTPSTRGLFWVITYVDALGRVIAANQIMAQMEYVIDIKYEDA